jgi:Ca2+-binding RTX toxin-like protein
MRRLLLVLGSLLLAAVPATASAAPGTLTISYSPDGKTFKLTGTDDYEGAGVASEGLSAQLGGGEGFRVLPNSSTGDNATTIALDASVPANTCELSFYAPGYRCRATGVTRITADLKGTGDSLDLGGAPSITGSSPAAPIPATVDAGDGRDIISGTNGDDILTGGPGDDDIYAHAGNDTLNGDGGSDRLVGESGNDTITGGDGDDQQYSTNAGAILTGGDGNDTINGGPGNDWVWGDGNDDTLSGDAGNDWLRGDEGADNLHGGGNDDLMDGGNGTDTFAGDAGKDTVTYATYSNGIYTAESPGVIVTLDGVANDGPIAETGRAENVDAEVVQGSSYADTITGNGSDNTLDGGAGNDTINGAGGDDTLIGGSDNDSFVAEPGADTYTGGGDAGDTLSYASRTTPVTVSLDGTANDGAAGEGDNVAANMGKVVGGSGADTLQGGTSNDTLDGGPGTDTVKGGPGDDTLSGGPGATPDTLDGEAGYNTVDYSARTAGVTVDLGNPSGDGEPGENDTLTNFRGITGGSGNDTLALAPLPANEGGGDAVQGRSLTGNGGNDTLTGTDAVDAIYGNAGADTIDALGGGDLVYGGDGGDTVNGGDGADRLYGDSTNDPGVGELSTDGVNAGDGADTINGGDGTDTLIGSGGNDTLHGDESNDTLWGGRGADLLDGGAGYDSVSYERRASGVAVTVDSGAGNDGNEIDGAAGSRDTVAAVESLIGSNAPDALTGSSADDSIAGRGGDDVLLGLGGNDTLDGGNVGDGGNGADVLNGGPGVDTVTYGGNSWWSGGVNVTLDGVANDGRGGTGESTGGANEAKDNVLEMEHVIGSIQGDTLTGSGADEILDGSDGPDTINAGGGNDTIIGGNGADTIDAGDGDDLIGTGYQDPTTPTYGAGDGARDVATGGPGDDRIVSNDRGGGAQGNQLRGGPGTDELSYLGEYEDVRASQDGVANDGVINGGAGDDVGEFEVITGGTGADTISGAGGARVLDGASGADKLTGDGDDETLIGGPGNDTLIGGGGDDLLEGGDDKDVITGGDGSDTATYASRGGSVKVTLDGLANDGRPATTSPVSAGEQDNVDTENVMGGAGDDAITGSGTANILRGGPGADTIDGGAGDDTVDGGPGRDALLSGTGTDLMYAADGQDDTLTCDTRTGKSVLVDATLDRFSTCADPSTVGTGGGGASGGDFKVLPLVTADPLGPANPGAPFSTKATLPGPSADALAALIKKLKGSFKLKGPGVPLHPATVTCPSGQRCTLRAVFTNAKKKPVARGTVSGSGKVTATAYLLPAGRKALKSGKPATFTLQLTLASGGSSATTSRRTTVKMTGGK